MQFSSMVKLWKGSQKGLPALQELKMLDAALKLTGNRLSYFTPCSPEVLDGTKPLPALKYRPALLCCIDAAGTGGKVAGWLERNLRCMCIYDMCHNDTNDAQDSIRAADMWGTVARIIIVNNAMIGAFKSDDFRQSMLDALIEMQEELPVTHPTMHGLLQAARFDHGLDADVEDSEVYKQLFAALRFVLQCPARCIARRFFSWLDTFEMHLDTQWTARFQ